MPVGGIAAVGSAAAGNVVDALYRQRVTEMSSGHGAEAAAGADTAQAARGADFAGAIGDGLGQLASMERTTTTQAARAATGDLQDIHDYVVAAASLQTATELTTTIRNKALDAFAEIMRMPL